MKIFILQLLLCSVSMTLVSVLYCTVSKLLSRIQSARWRYYGWMFIGIGFLTPFKPCFGKPLIELDAKRISEQVIYSYSGISQKGNTAFTAAKNEDIPDIWMLIFAVWITGMVLFLGYSLIRQMLFRRSVKRLSYMADSETVQLAEKLCREMGIRKRVGVYCMPVISTPMLTGIFTPCILLPVHNFSREELRLVLKHELAHFRHKDLYMKLFLVVCHAVHWFNPLVPFMFHFAEQECEQTCDERVMEGENSESAGIYCRSILKTAENRFMPNLSSPSVSTNFYSGKRSLQKRMKSILSTKKKYPMRIVCFLVCAATLATGTLAAYAETEQAAQFIRDSLTVTFDENKIKETQPAVEIDISEEYEEHNTVTTTALTEISSSESAVTEPVYVYDEPDLPAASTLPSEEVPVKTTSVTTVVTAVSDTESITEVTTTAENEQGSIPDTTPTCATTTACSETISTTTTGSTITHSPNTTVTTTTTVYTTTTTTVATHTETTTTATTTSDSSENTTSLVTTTDTKTTDTTTDTSVSVSTTTTDTTTHTTTTTEQTTTTAAIDTTTFIDTTNTFKSTYTTTVTVVTGDS